MRMQIDRSIHTYKTTRFIEYIDYEEQKNRFHDITTIINSNINLLLFYYMDYDY